MSVYLNYAAGGATCAACGEEITGGQELYILIHEKRPWLPEDHQDQLWPAVQWHKECDQGSLSAANAEDQRHHFTYVKCICQWHMEYPDERIVGKPNCPAHPGDGL